MTSKKDTFMMAQIERIPMFAIDEPGQVDRLEINPDRVRELADSIAAQGLLQPILLCKNGDRFEIIAGHRRFLAHQLLSRTTIDAIIKDVEPSAVAFLRATENLGRVDLTPIEEGGIYSRLISDYELTVDQVAKQMGISGGTVKRRLGLVSMPPQLQDAVHRKLISVGVAETLWSITDLSALDYYLGYAIDHGVTVAVSRDWVKEWKDQVRHSQTESPSQIMQQNPLASRPVYVSCDLCHGPMEIGKETVIRACSPCAEAVIKALAD